MGFHCVGQVGLKLLTLSNPPVLASQSAGITDVSHRARHINRFCQIVQFGDFKEIQPAVRDVFCFLSQSTIAQAIVAQSWLTATSASQAQTTLLPQPPR